MTLLLDAGYGHGNGYTVSIKSEPGEPHEGFVGILVSHSCYPPAIPKILDCLRHSGRYDCTLQAAWFARQAGSLFEELKNIGVDISITASPEYIDCISAHQRIPRRMFQ